MSLSKPKNSIWQAERLAGVAQRGHAADKVGAAAADHHIQRRRTVAAEMIAQCIRYRAKRLEDIGVVRLAADDEQDVGLLQPMIEADTGHLLHLVVRRVTAKIGGNDRILPKQFGHQRVSAAAEGRRENGAGRVDHVDVALPLIGAKLIDLLLERRMVDCEQMSRQTETLPARIVAIEPAFEVAAYGSEAAASVGAHADRVQLERGHSEIVKELPQLWQHLHQRRNDRLRRLELSQSVGNDKGFQPGERIERDMRNQILG